MKRIVLNTQGNTAVHRINERRAMRSVILFLVNQDVEDHDIQPRSAWMRGATKALAFLADGCKDETYLHVGLFLEEVLDSIRLLDQVRPSMRIRLNTAILDLLDLELPGFRMDGLTADLIGALREGRGHSRRTSDAHSTSQTLALAS